MRNNHNQQASFKVRDQMGLGELDLMRGDGQIGTRMRQILGQGARSGVVRCLGSGETQSALKAHARGFLARLPADGLGGQRYELTLRGRQVVLVLQKRGLIDADG